MKKNCILIFFVAAIFLAGIAIAGNNQLINLGGALYRDLNLSVNSNQSCMTCHHNGAGFADTENRVHPTVFPVSDGSIPTLFGGRNAPTAAYAGFSPRFHYDGELFVGGLFWDGRATGRYDVTATKDLGTGGTGDPLADQAKGPFGNPVEMALTPNTEATVVAIIRDSEYADLFEKVFPGALYPGNELVAYQNASIAIAAFERSKNINKFSSKFDKFVAEKGGDVSTFGVVCLDASNEPKTCGDDDFRHYVGPPDGFKSKAFSYDEAVGLALFNADSYTQFGESPPEDVEGVLGINGGSCHLCHLTKNHEVVEEDPNQPANGPAPAIYNPILTDFSYDNLGIPVNPQIATLAGPQPTDYGLGAQVEQLKAAYPFFIPPAEMPDGLGGYIPVVLDEIGKFKVSSLRNLSRTAPYGHNGFFATIFDIVHFYNTRDVPGAGWPEPEVPATVNTDELGNLGLTLEQELKLVKFLGTLND
jgi:cytochrome c peroxidase